MKLTLRRVGAVGVAALGAVFVAIGAVFSVTWAGVIGLGLLAVCLLAVMTFVYKHVLTLLAKVDQLQATGKNTLAQSKKTHVAVGKMAPALDRFVDRVDEELRSQYRAQSIQSGEQMAALRRIGTGMASLEQIVTQLRSDLESLPSHVDGLGEAGMDRVRLMLQGVEAKMEKGSEQVALNLSSVKERLDVMDSIIDAWLAEDAAMTAAAADLPEPVVTAATGA